jgi:hypothetical protein
MINLKVGESIPKSERITDLGFRVETYADEKKGLTSPSESYVRIRTRFADKPGTDYDAEAKAIEVAINNLLKLSKGLNYIAKHILEEFEIKARVETEGDVKFFVLDVVVVDPKHYENLFNIVESFREKEHDERIAITVETNFPGIIKPDEENTNPKVLYHVNSQLYTASRATILEIVKNYLKTHEADDLIARIIYVLSLKKLDLEVEIDFDLWQLLPPHLRPLQIMGVGAMEGLGLDFKIPLTTSMKKIATIFRDKMVAETDISARIGCLEARAWVNYPNLFESLLSRHIDL